MGYCSALICGLANQNGFLFDFFSLTSFTEFGTLDPAFPCSYCFLITLRFTDVVKLDAWNVLPNFL